ncbi:MAG: histidine phosphatase family protein, partial [Dehalococcoidia bacterium]|nr:histidine phosphatase family protein [Dehalococcoidia bacterium]
ILVRHGETYWNQQRRVQGGGSDVELNEVGWKQAAKLVSFLKTENIDTVISSPLKRALVIARIIADQHQLPIEIHDGLKEIDVGELEGLSLPSLSITFSQLLMQWWRGGSERLPGGESFVELQKRCWEAVEPLLLKYENGTVVIISHYFVTLAIIFKALDLPLEYLAKFRVDLGGVSILEFEDYGARLLQFNDTSYLSLLTG